MSSPEETFEVWPPYETFYIQAMLYNARSAVESTLVVSGLLKQISANDRWRHSDNNQLLNHLQNIVIQGGALSRYFWPSRTSYKKCAQFLRDALQIKDTSPLRDRDLRNRMEHFDERLADYLKDGVVGNIYPSYVGPCMDSDIPTHMFRAYYFDIGEFEMLGKRYAIQPLADEIWCIHERLTICEENGGRLRSMKDEAQNHI